MTTLEKVMQMTEQLSADKREALAEQFVRMTEEMLRQQAEEDAQTMIGLREFENGEHISKEDALQHMEEFLAGLKAKTAAHGA